MSLDEYYKLKKEGSFESQTGEQMPMNIGGRMVYQRERCVGMSDAERAWRAQWLKDQILHDEPVVPKDYYKKKYNIIRRIFRYPMNQVENALASKMGFIPAKTIRHMISNTGFLLLTSYVVYYWMKYNPGDWMRRSGPRCSFSRRATFPGDPGYPHVHHPKDNEFASFGFENSPI